MKDFFVSYNRNDKQWAEWIAWTLEEAGYSVVIQAWDFRPGGNFILDMNRAVEETQKTIAVLSDTYLDSAFTQPEWAAAFRDDPESIKRKLIPVKVKECKPTGLLSQVVYVDLTKTLETEAKQRLLDSLRKRIKPQAKPAFPGGLETVEQPPKTATFPQEIGQQRSSAPSQASKTASLFRSSDLCGEVCTSLKSLDYSAQELAFKGVVNNLPPVVETDLPPAAAFVVHGKSGRGQKWLVNRLVHACLGKQLDDVNKIPFSPRSDDTDIQEFWEYLGDRLLHKRDVTAEEIIDYIFQRWQMEDVVLVIHDADRMPATEPAKMIQQLWQPLMLKLDQAASKPIYSLYLFVVDNLSAMENWRLDCRQETADEDYCKPIALPAIEVFERPDITQWIRQNRSLPNLLPQRERLGSVAERLWNKGMQGVPELTMQAICDRIAPERHLWYEIVDSLDL
jgi:hypothetical protein